MKHGRGGATGWITTQRSATRVQGTKIERQLCVLSPDNPSTNGRHICNR